MASANTLFCFSLNDQRWCKRQDLKFPQLEHMSSLFVGSGGISTSSETDETGWRNVSGPRVPDPPGREADRPSLLPPPPARAEKPEVCTCQKAEPLAYHQGGTLTLARVLPFIAFPPPPHLNLSVCEHLETASHSEYLGRKQGIGQACQGSRLYTQNNTGEGRARLGGVMATGRAPILVPREECNCVQAPPRLFSLWAKERKDLTGQTRSTQTLTPFWEWTWRHWHQPTSQKRCPWETQREASGSFPRRRRGRRRLCVEPLHKQKKKERERHLEGNNLENHFLNFF